MKFGVRELLFVLLLLAIPSGAYIWIFQPGNKHIESQRMDVDAKDQKLISLRKALAGTQDLNEEVASLSQAVGFFENKLPEHHEIHNVLEQVTKIVEKEGLDTKLFKTLKPKPWAAYSEQPIQMIVYGNFEAYYKFLLALEKMPRITKIEQMHLEKDKCKEGMMEANIELSIYFAKGLKNT